MPKLKLGLLIPDLHAPYHDKLAWKLLLKVAHALGALEYVVIGGDCGDNYDISRFIKDPRFRVSFEDEIDDVNKRLDEIDELSAHHTIFIEGNHEKRLQNYILDKAPALVNCYNISDAYELKRRAYKFVPYRDDIKIGSTYLTHDVGFAGVNANKATFDAYQHNVIFFHTHNLSLRYYGNAAGDYRFCFNGGWLGDKKYIDYTHRAHAARWYTTGFGIFYLSEAGHMFVQAIPIVNNTCVVNGKLYNV